MGAGRSAPRTEVSVLQDPEEGEVPLHVSVEEAHLQEALPVYIHRELAQHAVDGAHQHLLGHVARVRELRPVLLVAHPREEGLDHEGVHLVPPPVEARRDPEHPVRLHGAVGQAAARHVLAQPLPCLAEPPLGEALPQPRRHPVVPLFGGAVLRRGGPAEEAQQGVEGHDGHLRLAHVAARVEDRPPVEAPPDQAPRHAHHVREGQRVELERVDGARDGVLPVRVLDEVLDHPAPRREVGGPRLVHLLEAQQVVAPAAAVEERLEVLADVEAQVVQQAQRGPVDLVGDGRDGVGQPQEGARRQVRPRQQVRAGRRRLALQGGLAGRERARVHLVELALLLAGLVHGAAWLKLHCHRPDGLFSIAVKL